MAWSSPISASRLLWLAWQTWVGEKEAATSKIDAKAMAAWFRHGLLLNLLVPHHAKAADTSVSVAAARQTFTEWRHHEKRTTCGLGVDHSDVCRLCLHRGNNYFMELQMTPEERQSYLDIVKRVSPQKMCEDIVNVQPMPPELFKNLLDAMANNSWYLINGEGVK